MFHLAPHSTPNTSTSSLSPTSHVLLSSSSPNPDLLSTHPFYPLRRSTAGWFFFGIPLLHTSSNKMQTALLVIMLLYKGGAESLRRASRRRRRSSWQPAVRAAEKELAWHPRRCSKLGSASFEASWRRLFSAYTPKRRKKSALRSMLLTSLSRTAGKTLTS